MSVVNIEEAELTDLTDLWWGLSDSRSDSGPFLYMRHFTPCFWQLILFSLSSRFSVSPQTKWLSNLNMKTTEFIYKALLCCMGTWTSSIFVNIFRAVICLKCGSSHSTFHEAFSGTSSHQMSTPDWSGVLGSWSEQLSTLFQKLWLNWNVRPLASQYPSRGINRTSWLEKESPRDRLWGGVCVQHAGTGTYLPSGCWQENS